MAPPVFHTWLSTAWKTKVKQDRDPALGKHFCRHVYSSSECCNVKWI